MSFNDVMETVGKAVDAAGVAVIVVGFVLASFKGLSHVRAGTAPNNVYAPYRQDVGRAILLGLEFLVAGDIIRTVAVSPSFRGAGVLAIIVLIRTFLSMSLQAELEGRLPWERRKATQRAA